MSYSNITDKNLEQQECEKDMIFLGLIAFKNELKKDTDKHIKELVNNNFDVCMITGDALETSISIGFRSGIIKNYEKVYIGKYNKSTNEIYWTEHEPANENKNMALVSSLSSYVVNTQPLPSIRLENLSDFRKIFEDCKKRDFVLAIEGNVFEKVILNINNNNIKEDILRFTKIFARCKPE